MAVLNTDNGAGRSRGWYVNGRDDVRDAMQPIADLLRNFGADGTSKEVSCGSDDCPFLLEGIPALKLWVDTAQYRAVHHQASDTFDKVDALSFRAGGAVVAITTYAIWRAADSNRTPHRAGCRSADPAQCQARYRFGVYALEALTPFCNCDHASSDRCIHLARHAVARFECPLHPTVDPD